jgi:hypothetical protein
MKKKCNVTKKTVYYKGFSVSYNKQNRMFNARKNRKIICSCWSVTALFERIDEVIHNRIDLKMRIL